MKEYDEAVIRKLQKYELSILKDFIAVCKEYHLTYFGIGGTGIGALRHKGFIPWDDDIDVGLPRRDYERLLEIFQEKYNDRYQIANAECMPGYPLMTSRIMIKGTKFVDQSLKSIKCEMGIFLDVFAYDNVADDEKKMKIQARTTWFWNKMLILRLMARPTIVLSGLPGKIVYFLCMFIHGILAVFRVSPKWIYTKCKKASCKYNDRETKRMAYFHDTSPYKNMISRKKSFPLIELEFEGMKVNFQRDLDEYLTELYGDYMQLPPVEKRKPHALFELDFGDVLLKENEGKEYFDKKDKQQC